MTHKASTEDTEFIRAFEAFENPLSDFKHYSHLRMGFTYLCEQDIKATSSRARRVLCSVLSHNGIEPSAKYHETMTRAWVLAVHHFMACTPETSSAAEFIEANPKLLDTGIMMTHYSKDLLFSDAARSSFVEPDLAPIHN